MRRKRLLLGLAVLAFVISFAAIRAASRPVFGDGKAKVVIERTPFFTEPEGTVDGSVRFSDDLTRWACTVERDGKKAVVVDGVEGPLCDEAGAWWEAYDWSGAGKPKDEIFYYTEFSPDGQHCAYTAKSNGRYCVVLDGTPGPEYDEVGFVGGAATDLGAAQVSQYFRISDDGRYFVYSARKGAKWVMVVSGVESPEYEPENNYHGIHWPHFSPDGKHIAHSGRRDGRAFAVVDGREGKAYDEVDTWSFRFSDDSAHVAYVAREREKWFVVLDDVEQARYDDVDVSPLSFNSGGTSYVAKRSGRSFVVCNGVEEEPHDEVEVIKFGDDGKPLVYWAKYGKRSFIMDHGVARNGYDGVSSFYVSDASQVLYKIHRGTKSCMVHNGIEGDWYDEVGYPCISAVGKRLAYKAKEGDKWRMVVDGVEYRRHESRPEFTFSPDGRHFFYSGQVSNKVIVDLARALNKLVGKQVFKESWHYWYEAVLDGRRLDRYDYIWPAFFTADGKHVVFVAKYGGEWSVFVDGCKAADVPRPFGYYTQREGGVIFPARGNDSVWQILTISAVDAS